jgi:prepilin-type N-terminal cleavage/methylation domain-containing protein
MKDDGGFSMVELLVAMAILSIVSILLLNFLDQTTQVTSRASNDVQAEQAAQRTLRVMTADLRSATGIFPNATGPCGAADYRSCITFNVPGSAGSVCPERQFTYALVGTAILKSQTNAPSPCATPVTVLNKLPIITGVQNGTTALFTYYDNNQNLIDAVGSPLSVPSAAAVIVTLKLSYKGSSVILNLSSTASLRNDR